MYREITHEEKRGRELERTESVRKGGMADDKSERFCRHEGERSICWILYTYVRALTRVVSVIQAQTESQRLNEF